ncbi:DUF4192 family protein [Phytomonospora endophytica]|uniref:DUF4192 domain-containing protein n=1 Tax=Phytomonospora endophytica TaxID=714109 RepID=A0A841G1J1_9ACTN|nr:DUF4192 family protein [Phytomonospora endophytica]MBB6038539.1 hypothetical protein [Phytomonospora endophytica]GIG69321.1 hypothetical protein Pen01_56160 [Phytomonospora endophytica]
MTYSTETPSELLAVIPHLAGHVISDAIVIVGLQPDGTIRAMWRVGAINPAVLSRIAVSLRDVEADLDAVILIGYAPVDIAAPALADLAAHIHRLGIDATLLVSHAGRHWDLNDPTCPAEGRPTQVSADITEVFTVAFGPVAADEDAVAAVLDPVTGAARAAMRAATTAFTTALTHDPLLLPRIDLAAIIDAEAAPDPHAAAHTAAALDRSIDTFMQALALTEHRPDTAMRLWIHLVRHAEPDYRGAPALLAAYSCALTGQGVLGCHVVAIAEHLIPHHPFTHPIAAAIRSGRVPSAYAAGLALIDPN